MTTLPDRQSPKKHGDVREVYHLGHRPPDGSLSATDWLLKERCRVHRKVRPSARVFHVLDRPIKNRMEFDRLGDEAKAQVLRNLDNLRDGLLAADVGTIPDPPTWNWARKWGYVLPHGQLLWPPEAARPIEGPYRQPEAQAILAAGWLAGTSQEGHWETDPFGDTRARPGKPNLTRHRNGSAQCHLKTGGQSTRLVTADADNHGLVLPPEVHAGRVVAFLELVQERWPEFRPHVTNLNYDDRSCHLPLHLPRAWGLEEARALLEALRQEFPWLREWQFYPLDMQGVRCPLSPDKGTVVDVVLGEAEHKRRSYGGKFARFQGHDWAAYLEWLESDSPCDLALVRQQLTRALDPAEVPKVRVMDRKGTPAPGRKGHKGREKALQVGLWTGELKPAPGDFGSFVAFTLRCLVLGYGWTPEAAADWVMEQVTPSTTPPSSSGSGGRAAGTTCGSRCSGRPGSSPRTTATSPSPTTAWTGSGASWPAGTARASCSTTAPPGPGPATSRSRRRRWKAGRWRRTKVWTPLSPPPPPPWPSPGRRRPGPGGPVVPADPVRRTRLPLRPGRPPQAGNALVHGQGGQAHEGTSGHRLHQEDRQPLLPQRLDLQEGGLLRARQLRPVHGHGPEARGRTRMPGGRSRGSRTRRSGSGSR